MKHLFSLLLSTIALTFSLQISAQDEEVSQTDSADFKVLTIGGKITDHEDKKMKKVIVELFEENKVVDSYKTKGNGKFGFELMNDKIYTLQLSKDGFYIKRITINTSLPDGVKEEFFFDFDIGLVPELEEDVKAKDESLYDFPSAIIHFDDRKKEFHFDKNYTRDLMKDIRASARD